MAMLAAGPGRRPPTPVLTVQAGDSGGPLFMNGLSSTTDVQYGISAFTWCGRFNAPGECTHGPASCGRRQGSDTACSTCNASRPSCSFLALAPSQPDPPTRPAFHFLTHDHATSPPLLLPLQAASSAWRTTTNGSRPASMCCWAGCPTPRPTLTSSMTSLLPASSDGRLS